jgi:hypothetical protein
MLRRAFGDGQPLSLLLLGAGAAMTVLRRRSAR